MINESNIKRVRVRYELKPKTRKWSIEYWVDGRRTNVKMKYDELSASARDKLSALLPCAIGEDVEGVGYKASDTVFYIDGEP